MYQPLKESRLPNQLIVATTTYNPHRSPIKNLRHRIGVEETKLAYHLTITLKARCLGVVETTRVHLLTMAFNHRRGVEEMTQHLMTATGDSNLQETQVSAEFVWISNRIQNLWIARIPSVLYVSITLLQGNKFVQCAEKISLFSQTDAETLLNYIWIYNLFLGLINCVFWPFSQLSANLELLGTISC